MASQTPVLKVRRKRDGKQLVDPFTRKHETNILAVATAAILVVVLLGATDPSVNSCRALMFPTRHLFRTRGCLSKNTYRTIYSQHHWQHRIFYNTANTDTTSTMKNNNGRTTASSSYSADLVTDNGVSVDEIELTLTDGMIVRGQRWATATDAIDANDSDNNKTATKILALHGWLDNCRSFHYLAPKLMERFHDDNDSNTTNAAELVAIDLPGHGLSAHRPLDGPTAVLSEATYYIAETIDALGWENDKISLIGHSMGGSLATMYAGVFPDKVSSVVSIDIYGPEPGNPKKAASQIRSHITQRRAGAKPHTLYPSLEKAIERRQKSAKWMVGKQNQPVECLSLEAATELVTRSMEPIYEENSTNAIQGYRFKHDARLLWPSLQYLTIEQIQSILEAIECPVCILAGKEGYPFTKDRIDRILEALQPKIHTILPGSHHLHADPDTAEAVVSKIYDFLGGSGDK